MSDDDIYHFGVKGMKWGQRKRRESQYFKPGRVKPDFEPLKKAADSKGLRNLKKNWQNRDMSDSARYTRHREFAGIIAGVAVNRMGRNVVGHYLRKNGHMNMASALGGPYAKAVTSVGAGAVGRSLGLKLAASRQAAGKAGYQKRAALERQ